ncbi:AAA family ATPase [Zooshikella harenae]|uniref:AAA family ATPase n=1 Tax=Zooshikella harenae TaxID=2827238 RepID=A0ABS5ZGL7_9GAMM|nr:AAA family ATPase [Zooshikella harenae]MBU2713125.1 AAA family ATPase [Zooshikella harenae]
MEHPQLIALQESTITAYYQHVYGTLTEFNYSMLDTQERPSTTPIWPYTTTSGNAIQQRKVKLIQCITNITPHNPLASEKQHHVISCLQRGLAIATALVEQFSTVTKLKQLQEENIQSLLPPEKRNELTTLHSQASYVALHCLAHYLLHQLASSKYDFEQRLPSIKQLKLNSPLDSVKHFLAYLAEVINSYAKTDQCLTDVVVQASKILIGTLSTLCPTQTQNNPFFHTHYHVAKEDFSWTIFLPPHQAYRKKLLPVNFKQSHEVFGNFMAKQEIQKLAKILVCYDFKRQLNPFIALGGVHFNFMLSGIPGSGKTTLIQFLAGLVKHYCEVANYPFYFENLDINCLHPYQGQSAANANQFIQNVLNPYTIAIGCIDQADFLTGKQSPHQTAPGQHEITTALLDTLCGIRAHSKGNCVFALVSNNPDNLNPQLKQCISTHLETDKVQSSADLTKLLNHSLGDIVTKGEDTRLNPRYPSSNEDKKEQSSADLKLSDQLQMLYQETITEIGELNTLSQFGYYLHKIQQTYPQFTYRIIKQIIDAVKASCFDIALPDEWFENPLLFLHKPYEEKVNMLAELRRPFDASILLQITHSYAERILKLTSTSD